MTDFDPICDVGRTEIPQRSDLLTSAARSIQNDSGLPQGLGGPSATG
jgi:hypothetical protein